MKKSEIAQAYKKYLWPKCSRTTFYINIKMWMSILEAIKPIGHEQRYKKNRIRTKKFEQELKWYMEQEWEKATKNRFYQRLYQGWNKEDAIKIWGVANHKMTEKKIKPSYQRPVVLPLQKNVKEDSYIRISYTTEEAKVFRREYENMINELQEKYSETDDVIEAREINNKLERIIKEYQVFRLYNDKNE